MEQPKLKKAPAGLAALAMIGPGLVWSAEYIGNGEVILATRAGAILGTAVLWAPLLGIILKACMGIGGAHYTVCTGEGMMDMFSRMPGPKNWAVWMVLIGMMFAGTFAAASAVSLASVLASSMLPLPPFIWGWIIALFVAGVVWSGVFDVIKYVMGGLIFIIIFGVIFVTVQLFPGVGQIAKGIFGFAVPVIPAWAVGLTNVSPHPWREVMPLVGWAAGGFASQVWYTYWIIGAGFGMTEGRGSGKPCDTGILKSMTRDTAETVKGWCRVVYLDGSTAMIIGLVVTSCFLISGAVVLRPAHVAPDGAQLAVELSMIFQRIWGMLGAKLFIISGLAALINTTIGHFAGWPRLYADGLRICIPAFARKFTWNFQFKMILTVLLFTNFVVVYTLGVNPVFLTKMSAIIEGLLFTPLQAVFIMVGLWWVMPRLLSGEAWKVLRPHWIFVVGLVLGIIVFTIFSVVQLAPMWMG